jgi:hypothetical protein
MPPLGFEPATPASDRPQTLALDHSATGLGKLLLYLQKFLNTFYTSTMFFYITYLVIELINNLVSE